MALFSFEQRWAATIARTFLPLGVLGGTTDRCEAGARISADDAPSPWHAALLLRVALWLVWFAPLWRSGRLRTVGGLDVPDREALLEALLLHRSYAIRQMTMYLKLVSCTALLGDLGVLTYVGAYRLPGTRGGTP